MFNIIKDFLFGKPNTAATIETVPAAPYKIEPSVVVEQSTNDQVEASAPKKQSVAKKQTAAKKQPTAPAPPRTKKTK